MIVLDTHAWIWWVGRPELLSEKAKQRIGRAMDDASICISSISCWEVSLLVKKAVSEPVTRLCPSLPLRACCAKIPVVTGGLAQEIVQVF